jgi:hypothetical protein
MWTQPLERKVQKGVQKVPFAELRRLGGDIQKKTGEMIMNRFSCQSDVHPAEFPAGDAVLQYVGDAPDGGVFDPGVDVPVFGVEGGEVIQGHVDGRDHGLAKDLKGDLEVLGQALARGGGFFKSGGGFFPGADEHVFQHRWKDIVARFKIMDDERLAEPAVIGDLLKGRVAVTIFGDTIKRTLNYLLFSFFSLGPGLGHLQWRVLFLKINLEFVQSAKLILRFSQKLIN